MSLSPNPRSYRRTRSTKPAALPVCATCSAIPLGVFRRLSMQEKPPPLALDISGISEDELDQISSRGAPATVEDCCYQHYSSSDALMAKDCPLCTILWFSLEASRQSLPRSALKTPELPKRLATETGITLHSFDDSHFIVRDNSRWSLVRFSKGNRLNKKGFLLHENANDEGVFSLINDWIFECTRSHDSCTHFRLNVSPGYTPARLISIGQAQNQLRPRLCDRGGYESEFYVALSHCWGSNPELVPRTTRTNLQSRMTDIPWQDLTKTFQDAMEATVKLGIKYIWIDSLCIVQDDYKDVEIHCESMSQIYSNSFCTISATGAMDGTEGCFMPRNNVEMHPCVIVPAVLPDITEESSNIINRTVNAFGVYSLTPTRNQSSGESKDRPGQDDTDHSETDQDEMDQDETDQSGVFTILPTFREWIHSMKGHLLSRGWTLQERELSVRVIHFTPDRVVWECREYYASEDDPTLMAKSMLFDVGLKFRLLDGNGRDRKDRPHNYKFSKWMDLVEEYSMRKLSVKQDKLKAIAGLADAIKSIQQDDVYLYGLWKRDLVRELLWHAIPSPKHSGSSRSWPPTPVARGIPSWSWAAYDGAVVFERNETIAFSADVRKVISSQITLCGPVFSVPLSKAEHGLSEIGVNQKSYKWPRGNSTYQIYITLDVDPQSPQKLDLLCLVLIMKGPTQTEQSRTGLPTYSQSSSGTSLPTYSQSSSGTSLPTYSQSSSRSNTQYIPCHAWDGDCSASGLVLLRGYETPGVTTIFRRVGIFNAMGHLPVKKAVEVNIL